MKERKITIIDEKLYTLQEIAEILRVSERSVFRYIHGARLKATKIGYWRISGKDLTAFLMSGSSENLKDYVKTPKKKK